MKRLALALAVSAALITPVLAGDKHVLQFSPQSWGDAFDRAAKAVGDNSHARKQDCNTTNGVAACTYKISSFADAGVTGKSMDGPAASVMLTVGGIKGPEQTGEVILYWAFFVRTVDPSSARPTLVQL